MEVAGIGAVLSEGGVEECVQRGRDGTEVSQCGCLGLTGLRCVPGKNGRPCCEKRIMNVEQISSE